MLRVKRTYEAPSRSDGTRVLVERLWPRGVKKEALKADAWLKEVAPSTRLRQWFGHRPERWDEFKRRYQKELEAHPEAWQPLLAAGKSKPVTLLFSARDEEHNNAVALREFLASKES